METQTSNQKLIKGRDLVGLKVVTVQKGKIVDDVEELVFDPQDNMVKALVVDPGGFLKGAKVILFEDIKTIGRDAVIIESDELVKKADDVQESISRIVRDDNYLTANRVMTEDGTDLGRVSDIYFDPRTGKVFVLEVSQGAVKNVQSGKKRVNVSDIVKVGEDVTIVRKFAEMDFETQGQTQGLIGAAKSAREKAPGIVEQIKEKASEIAQDSRQKIEEVKNDPNTQKRIEELKSKATAARDTVAQKAMEGREKIKADRKTDALGKYLSVNILSPGDEIIARRGEIVTNELLFRAESLGMLEKVLGNISTEPIELIENTEVEMKIKNKDIKQ